MPSLATRRRMNAAALRAAGHARAPEPAAPAPQPAPTLARRKRARALGEQHAAEAAARESEQLPVKPSPAASEYDLQKARLGVDLRRLSEIQSIERKIDLKRELLPQYRDWVAGVLAADAGGDDVILTHVMIWSIDVGDFAHGLDLADYVLRHDLPLPERFDRTPATLIVEEIAEAVLKLLGSRKLTDVSDDQLAPFGGDPSVLDRIDEIAEHHDMPDEVKAKVHKAIGLVTLRQAELLAENADGPAGLKRATTELALREFERAFSLDTKIGVKKRIERLQREIARQPDADT